MKLEIIIIFLISTNHFHVESTKYTTHRLVLLQALSSSHFQANQYKWMRNLGTNNMLLTLCFIISKSTFKYKYLITFTSYKKWVGITTGQFILKGGRGADLSGLPQNPFSPFSFTNNIAFHISTSICVSQVLGLSQT